jgi:opacity protein-like surface antigen
VASAQIDINYDDRLIGFSSSSSGREIGWAAGTGIDYALTPNLFLGLECSYLISGQMPRSPTSQGKSRCRHRDPKPRGAAQLPVPRSVLPGPGGP